MFTVLFTIEKKNIRQKQNKKYKKKQKQKQNKKTHRFHQSSGSKQ